MPAYDFKCTACANTFEVTRPMGQRGDETCPSCGEVATKVFSPVGVAFKGTGFHNTDYKPRPKEDTASAGTDSGSTCGAKSEGGSACASCPAAS